MEINNLYIYYNKNGQVISRTMYEENNSVRQGSTFNLNLLFDKGYIQQGDAVLLYFKWPKKDAEDLPYAAFYDDFETFENDLTFIHFGPKVFDKDFSRFGIQKNVEYDMWSFKSSAVVADGLPNLTELDGNLEVTPNVIKQSGDIIVLGVAKVFIEKDP